VILTISLQCSRTPLDERSARRRYLFLTTHNTHNRLTSIPRAGIEPATPASERPQTHALGYGYTEARNDTTQQSGQTPDEEVEIKNITDYNLKGSRPYCTTTKIGIQETVAHLYKELFNNKIIIT